jgi:hypothetical protein
VERFFDAPAAHTVNDASLGIRIDLLKMNIGAERRIRSRDRCWHTARVIALTYEGDDAL